MRKFKAAFASVFLFSAIICQAAPPSSVGKTAMETFIPVGSEECSAAKWEIQKALVVYNSSHPKDRQMVVLDRKILLEEKCLKNDVHCPASGTFQGNEFGEVKCSIHDQNDLSSAEGHEKFCEKNVNRIAAALKLYDVGTRDLSDTSSKLHLPADLKALVDGEYLKVDPKCPGGGTYRFDETGTVKCSTHGK